MDEQTLAAIIVVLLKRLNVESVDITEKELTFNAALFGSPSTDGDTLRISYTDLGDAACHHAH